MKEYAVPAKGNICGKYVPARYQVAILGSFGMAIVYSFKVYLSIAIVSMVNQTAIHEQNLISINPSADEFTYEECMDLTGNVTDSLEDGPFIWSETQQGLVLSSYFWGYIISQIPGGRISELFSAKWVMFFAVAINILLTILTPFAAELHFGAMLALRIGQGIGGGLTFPAMNAILAHWAPPNERSILSNIVYAGTALGTVISILASGIITASMGWEEIFYIMGYSSALWLIFWGYLIADGPEKQSMITQQERDYIVTSLGGNIMEKQKPPPIPWKSILRSPAFLALLVAHICNNWGWYMVLIEMPIFMKNVLKFKITKNSALAVIPFVCMWIFSMFLSICIDILRTKNMINTTHARKMAIFISSFIPMVCFLVLSYIGCMQTEAVVLLTIAIAASGGMFCGLLSNHMDIANNYAGTLMALTNTAATIPGIIIPIFAGQMIQSEPSIYSWRIIFGTTTVLYLVEIVMYGIFGSGNEQAWNKSYYNNNIESQARKPSITRTDTDITPVESNYQSANVSNSEPMPETDE